MPRELLLLPHVLTGAQCGAGRLGASLDTIPSPDTSPR